ncbi:MAG TPA: patatin-like phospholipase family protein [Gemmatimonadales bacterium]|nr:patatin-like phospholipase family protein [Gemmatimonadales bacterium]
MINGGRGMRVVAVFGGGGAKGLAHAGAWRALVEAGLTPGHIVGTSMGAVVGAAFAAGSTYDGFVAAARQLRSSDVAAVDPIAFVAGVFTSHLFRAAPLHRTIGRLVPATRFGDLRIPLTITTTDVDSGDLVLYGSLGNDAPLVDALYASCALPLYYPAAQIDGHRLADGGLRAVLPLEVARRVPADLVVAISVGPGFDEPPADRKAAIPAMIRAHGEAIRVMMAAQTERAIAAWPPDAPRLIVVRAVAEREATFAVGSGERFLDAGYRTTRAALAGVTT